MNEKLECLKDWLISINKRQEKIDKRQASRNAEIKKALNVGYAIEEIAYKFKMPMSTVKFVLSK